jgi:hypothetical protein
VLVCRTLGLAAVAAEAPPGTGVSDAWPDEVLDGDAAGVGFDEPHAARMAIETMRNAATARAVTAAS